MSVTRLEVISTGSRRRWTPAEKHRIVAESAAGPRLVSATARRHGLTAQQLFTWRRLAREGRLGGSAAPPSCAPVVVSGAPVAASGRIEIVLVQGQRVIVDKDVDASALARVVAVLTGR